MILESIVDINHGIPLSRIRLDEGMESEERFVYSFEEETKLKVPKNIEDIEQKIPIVKENMILLNITSYNAKIAELQDVGKIISSNYMSIVVLEDSEVDSDYLEWYLDKSDSFKREINRIKQGSTVRSIPINEFRKLNIELPDIDFQIEFGRLNKLNKRREKLFWDRQELIEKSFIYINEEAIKNG